MPIGLPRRPGDAAAEPREVGRLAPHPPRRLGVPAIRVGPGEGDHPLYDPASPDLGQRAKRAGEVGGTVEGRHQCVPPLVEPTPQVRRASISKAMPAISPTGPPRASISRASARSSSSVIRYRLAPGG